MIYPKTSKNGFTSRWRETPCIIFLLKKLVSVQKTKFPLNEVNFPVTSRTSRAAPQQADAAAPRSSRTQRRTGKLAVMLLLCGEHLDFDQTWKANTLK